MIEVEVAIFKSTLMEMASIDEVSGKEILPKFEGTCNLHAGAAFERSRTVTFVLDDVLSYQRKN